MKATKKDRVRVVAYVSSVDHDRFEAARLEAKYPSLSSWMAATLSRAVEAKIKK